MQIDYGDGAKDCQLKMTRLQAMPLDKHYKHLSKFFADVCPMLGKVLSPDFSKAFGFLWFPTISNVGRFLLIHSFFLEEAC